MFQCDGHLSRHRDAAEAANWQRNTGPLPDTSRAAWGLVDLSPSPVATLLHSGRDDEVRFASLRESEGTGRPLGNADFIAGLEKLLGRPLARRAAGRKPAATPDEQTKRLE